MLTNNKKSYFIKSIAMIMAVLMVLAVALTGCGNKAAEEAAQKADQAQNTANEAKSAAEKIAADLVNYLKIEKAVTVEAVTKMITDALGAHPTKDDLLAYVKNEDMMTAINEKIAALVTADQVAAQITKALEGYATSAALGDAKAELTKKIADEVAKVNKNNEVKALQDKAAKLESDLAAAKAALEKADKDNKAALQAEVDAVEAALANAKKALEAADKKLAADIAAIAKDYLKAADKTALEALIAANTSSITTLQGKIDALSTKLDTETAKLATEAALETAINELKDADGKLAADIKQLQETVMAILEAFGIKPSTSTDGEANLGDLLSKYDPSAITALIADKMSLTDWNKATEIVIDTIGDVQEMMAKIYGADGVAGTTDDGIYTHADKMTITNAVKKVDPDIIVFDEDGKLTEYATVAKLLEYRILRVPTVKAMNELKDHLDEALNVKTFDQKLAALTAELKALGCEHTKGTPAVTSQVVTVDDLADFYEINTKIDELITSYRFDIRKDANGNWIFTNHVAKSENQFVGTPYENTFGAMPVYQVMKGTYKNNTQPDKYIIVTDLKDNATYPKTADYTYARYNKYTINNTLGDTNGSQWAPKYTDESGLKNDDVALYKLPEVATHFAWDNDAHLTSKAFEDGHGKYAINVTVADKKDATLAATYMAVYTQLEDCIVAINVANKTLADFITTQVMNGKIKIDGREMTLAKAVADGVVKDAQKANYYVEALEIGMCEPLTQADAQSGKLFLTIEVQTAMEFALGRNTCPLNAKEGDHSEVLVDRIPDYELYYDLMDEAWVLLFQLYQERASKLQDKIINDYRSILYAVDAPDAFDYNDLAFVKNATYINGTWKDMATQNLVSNEVAGTTIKAIFINAFLNGADTFSWKTEGTVAKTGITIEKKDFNEWAMVNYYGTVVDPITGKRIYVANNGLAATGNKPENVIWSNPLATIAANVPVLELLIASNTYDVVTELGNLKGADIAKEDRGDIKTFFNSYLEKTIDNLEEVYNRFLLEDYKADVINDLYYAADVYTDFYSVDERAALLQEALEHYITGYSVTASTAAKAGEANKLFNKETLLNNATVLTELAKVTFEADLKKPTWADTTVVYAATEAKATVVELAYTSETTVDEMPVSDAFIGVLENAAVKNNFEDYLATAINNVEYVYGQYKGAANMTSDLTAAVEAARQQARYNISVIQWQTSYNTDDWAMLTYKTYYKQLLLQIASKEAMTAKHFVYLTGTTVAKAMEAIKSLQELKYVADPHNVVRPVKIVTALDQYYCFGAAAYLMDKAANNNTKYLNAQNKEVNLYE